MGAVPWHAVRRCRIGGPRLLDGPATAKAAGAIRHSSGEAGAKDQANVGVESSEASGPGLVPSSLIFSSSSSAPAIPANTLTTLITQCGDLSTLVHLVLDNSGGGQGGTEEQRYRRQRENNGCGSANSSVVGSSTGDKISPSQGDGEGRGVEQISGFRTTSSVFNGIHASAALIAAARLSGPGAESALVSSCGGTSGPLPVLLEVAERYGGGVRNGDVFMMVHPEISPRGCLCRQRLSPPNPTLNPYPAGTYRRWVPVRLPLQRGRWGHCWADRQHGGGSSPTCQISTRSPRQAPASTSAAAAVVLEL